MLYAMGCLVLISAPALANKADNAGDGQQDVPGSTESSSSDQTDIGQAVDLHMTAGASLFHDPSWEEENVALGADGAARTGVAPTLGVRAAGVLGPVQVAGGVDLAVPTGTWQSLPVGDRRLRTRAVPWVGAGPEDLPVVDAQVQVGLLVPWHLALGLRGQLPLRPGLDLELSWVEGVGLGALRGGDRPRPGLAHVVFLGLSTPLPVLQEAP